MDGGTVWHMQGGHCPACDCHIQSSLAQSEDIPATFLDQGLQGKYIN